MRKAVVLLSGGLDSTTSLALATAQGYAVYALSIDYGQRHRRELMLAAQSAKRFAVRQHRTVKLDLRAIGGSALTAEVDVPKSRTADEMSAAIPVTYVPARNTILLGVALGYAETVGAFDIFIGANALDYAGYPDCRPAFLQAFEALANVATKAGLEGTGRFAIHAPLIQSTKAEIIRQARDLGVNFAETWSCYDPVPTGRPCGTCDACVLRAEGFAEAGVPDSSVGAT